MCRPHRVCSTSLVSALNEIACPPRRYFNVNDSILISLHQSATAFTTESLSCGPRSRFCRVIHSDTLDWHRLLTDDSTSHRVFLSVSNGWSMFCVFLQCTPRSRSAREPRRNSRRAYTPVVECHFTFQSPSLLKPAVSLRVHTRSPCTTTPPCTCTRATRRRRTASSPRTPTFNRSSPTPFGRTIAWSTGPLTIATLSVRAITLRGAH